MKKKVNIIGSGFASLSAACYLAQAGFEVIVFEKNDTLGGRARQLEIDGFKFDMGPTWYWMPDVFERFFNDFNKKPCNYFQLQKLDPGYKIYFKDDVLTISSEFEKIKKEFERIEKGSGAQLEKLIDQAEANYDIAIKDLVYNPGISPLELVNVETAKRLYLFFQSISGQIKSKFKNPLLKQALEFPSLFLGAKPSKTPAFYNFMNYADLKLGTWHPIGGMHSVVKGIIKLAKDLGVKFETGQSIKEISVKDGTTNGILSESGFHEADVILSGADYHHTEQLLDKHYRQYNEEYWNKRTFAPSALMFYVGFNKKLVNLDHHMLFFDADFKKHSEEIYDEPKWPMDPLFYASFPSVTDQTIAPEGRDMGIFLIPISAGIEEAEDLHSKYFDSIINRLEKRTKQNIKDNISFKKTYSISNFKEDYNAFKGNAYGLANTLKQTAFLRPKLKSKKVNGLFFTGQLTVPGPGVPPSLISGKLSSQLIINEYLKN